MWDRREEMEVPTRVEWFTEPAGKPGVLDLGMDVRGRTEVSIDAQPGRWYCP